jgi:hypothetical protein
MDNTIDRIVMVGVFGVCCRTTGGGTMLEVGRFADGAALPSGTGKAKVVCYAENSKSYRECNRKVLCFA